MAQCKAETAGGIQCVSEAASPSRTLCKRHQTMVTGGKVVINFDTGRKVAGPTLGGEVARATASSSVQGRAGASPARAPRAAMGTVEVEEPRAARGPGEHPLVCDGPRCGSQALPGSDYCMKHQGLA